MPKLKNLKRFNYRTPIVWISLFATIGLITLLITKAATPGLQVVVDNTLPNPTNVRAFADDRVATIAWDPPADAAGKSIVGYYVTWGTGSTYTDAKQTVSIDTQIQPLTNGQLYNVKVQSVQGTTVQVDTADAWGGGTSPEARANGRVSTGATVAVTPSSARVDQLRTQMTGFFDDFNTPSGALDEKKWNTAVSNCVKVGTMGSFINSQFHAHTQERSDCDRSQVINRARGIFDISGKTEANPGVINFDFDGITHGRDFWYVDLIPLNARNSNVPLDITSHADAFDGTVADPAMIRLTQNGNTVSMNYTSYDKSPHRMTTTFNCPGWASQEARLDSCQQKIDSPPKAGLSPLPSQETKSGCYQQAQVCLGLITNLRRHWRMEVSGTKINVFIDESLILTATMPSDFTNVKQYTVENNLFSYNTGKDDSAKPTTSMLHWDNFGFNGPAQTTVTHNYIDGGADGSTPIIGVGTAAATINRGPRNLKINIPDPVGSPKQARLMFTIGNGGQNTYSWSSSDNIVVNGKTFSYPNPTSAQSGTPLPFTGYTIPFADSIILSPSDLRQGMNDIKLNIGTNVGSMSIINVHAELEYTKGTEPAYTQPTAIFGASTLLSSIMPTMGAHDHYIFTEQDMGLPSVPSGGTPPPPPVSDITPPSIPSNLRATAPSATQVNLSWNASTDNVSVIGYKIYGLNGTGVPTVVKATIGAVTSYTDTAVIASKPYSYAIEAIDAAGNASGKSTTVNVTTPAGGTSTASPSGTVITPGNGTITDTSGGVWTVTSGAILQLNGVTAGANFNVTQALWFNGTMYHVNTSNQWYSWNNGSNGASWTGPLAGDPRGTTPSVTKKCDFNADNIVDVKDLSILLSNFNLSVAIGTKGDCNGSGDGKVDVYDLSALLGVFGK